MNKLQGQLSFSCEEPGLYGFVEVKDEAGNSIVIDQYQLLSISEYFNCLLHKKALLPRHLTLWERITGKITTYIYE